MIISNREIENIDQLLETAVNYAKENGIIRIIIFIKNIDNVMKLKELLGDEEITLIATTFPMNQPIYIENEDEEIEKIIPGTFNRENQELLKKANIQLISSTLPLDPIVIPKSGNKPYSIITNTLDLFGPGVALAIQSSLMAVDNGAINPEERVLSLTNQSAVDLKVTNSRFLFHPKVGLKVNQIIY